MSTHHRQGQTAFELQKLMPTDIFSMICNYLPLLELVKCLEVCRYWNYCCMKASSWKYTSLTISKLHRENDYAYNKSQQLLQISKYWCLLHSLDIGTCTIYPNELSMLTRKLQHLKYLNIDLVIPYEKIHNVTYDLPYSLESLYCVITYEHGSWYKNINEVPVLQIPNKKLKYLQLYIVKFDTTSLDRNQIQHIGNNTFIHKTYDSLETFKFTDMYAIRTGFLSELYKKTCNLKSFAYKNAHHRVSEEYTNLYNFITSLPSLQEFRILNLNYISPYDIDFLNICLKDKFVFYLDITELISPKVIINDIMRIFNTNKIHTLILMYNEHDYHYLTKNDIDTIPCLPNIKTLYIKLENDSYSYLIEHLLVCVNATIQHLELNCSSLLPVLSSELCYAFIQYLLYFIARNKQVDHLPELRTISLFNIPYYTEIQELQTEFLKYNIVLKFPKTNPHVLL
jgi:hypothetical protein